MPPCIGSSPDERTVLIRCVGPAYQLAFDDITPTAAIASISTGQPFTVADFVGDLLREQLNGLFNHRISVPAGLLHWKGARGVQRQSRWAGAWAQTPRC
jgi:hypothetical protein